MWWNSRRRAIPAWRGGLLPILISCWSIPAPLGQAANSITVTDIVQALERQEARIRTASFKYTHQQFADVDTHTSFTKLLISTHEKSRWPATQEYVKMLREGLAAFERRGTAMWRKRTFQCVIERQLSGDIRYSRSELRFQPDQGTTVVTHIEIYDGQRYLSYYPRDAQARISDKPDMWDLWPPPYARSLYYHGMPQSRFISTHNPEVVSTSGGLVIVRCIKLRTEGSMLFGGLGIVNQDIFLFKFTFGRQCVLREVESGWSGGVSPFRTKVVEQVPTNRYIVEYKECSDGILFPTRLTVEFFHWLPTNSKGRRWRMYNEGIYQVSEVTDYRVNEVIPATAFTPRLPWGTKVRDRVRKKTYREPRWLDWWRNLRNRPARGLKVGRGPKR